MNEKTARDERNDRAHFMWKQLSTPKGSNPKGWPKHLMDYDPSQHAAICLEWAVAFPYDQTKTRVKSYVLIDDEGDYFGIAHRGWESIYSLQAERKGGKAIHAKTLDGLIEQL